MSLRVLIDMNLSPLWVGELQRHGLTAVHWSAVGNADDDDGSIMRWAADHNYVVFTHDLDFGSMLALTHATGPSVLQVRGRGVLPEQIGDFVTDVLERCEEDLIRGALVVVEPGRNRVRVLRLPARGR